MNYFFLLGCNFLDETATILLDILVVCMMEVDIDFQTMRLYACK